MFAAGAAVVVGLTGCSSGGAATTEPAASGGTVSLDWGFWNQGDQANAMWSGLASEVSTQDPAIKVTLTQVPFADYFTKLQSQLASNSAPCIVSMQSLRLPTFVKALEPLDDLMKEQGFKKDEWNPAALTALQRDGKQYAIPFGISTMLMYYNKDVFQASGVAEPQAGWSISDFEAAAKKITQSSGKPAFGQSFSDLHLFSLLQAYNGARPVADDGTLTLTTGVMKKSFSWYSGLSTQQKVALVPASSSDTPWGEQQFVAGNVAMAVDGSWNLSSNAKDAKFKVGVSVLPVGEGGVASFSANSGFAISKNCPNKKAAAKAIAILTSSAAQTATANGGTLPARAGSDDAFYKSLATAVDGKSPGFSAQAKAAVNDSSKTARPFIPSNSWDQTTKLNAREFILSYTGNQTPEASLQNVQDASR